MAPRYKALKDLLSAEFVIGEEARARALIAYLVMATVSKTGEGYTYDLDLSGRPGGKGPKSAVLLKDYKNAWEMLR